jgi:hypothetical protein
MIHEPETLAEVEEILARHYAALCESKRVEVAFVQPARPQGHPDVVTLKDALVCLLAALLLLAVLGRLA